MLIYNWFYWYNVLYHYFLHWGIGNPNDNALDGITPWRRYGVRIRAIVGPQYPSLVPKLGWSWGWEHKNQVFYHSKAGVEDKVSSLLKIVLTVNFAALEVIGNVPITWNIFGWEFKQLTYNQSIRARFERNILVLFCTGIPFSGSGQSVYATIQYC